MLLWNRLLIIIIQLRHAAKSIRAPECIESFVGITDERQAVLSCNVFARLSIGRPDLSRRVVLIDFVNREVLRVDVGLQTRFKRRSDASKTIPVDPTEEGMLLDLARPTNATETMFGIANQARGKLA